MRQPRPALRDATTSLWEDGAPTVAELDVVDWLLTTTRSCRRTLDLTRDVDSAVVEECLRVAIQAPTSHNEQRWHWIVVTDAAKRAAVADAYRRTWDYYARLGGRKVRRWRAAPRHADANLASALWLPEHLAEVPVHVIPCLLGEPPDEHGAVEVDRPASAVRGALATISKGVPSTTVQPPSGRERTVAYWASIYPAVWSFQLALRARGLGSVMTCMHLGYHADVAHVLELPDSVTQACLLPVAYVTRTRFTPAKRVPLEQRISWNTWLGAR